MDSFLLLDRGSRPGMVEDLLARFRETARRHRIRCPTCGWQPQASSRWYCAAVDAPEHFSPGCGTSWQTFETRGRCPGCEHQWQWTSCLSCGMWARHEDWYTAEDDDEA